jgi:hypothetical protein
MRKDTRFARPDRSEIETKLPAGCLSDAQCMGIWNMMLQSDSPGEVARWYRSYRDSDHCTVPRQKLRAMRDTMITAMREANKKDPNPRKEKQAGVHYDRGHLHNAPTLRKGA